MKYGKALLKRTVTFLLSALLVVNPVLGAYADTAPEITESMGEEFVITQAEDAVPGITDIDGISEEEPESSGPADINVEDSGLTDISSGESAVPDITVEDTEVSEISENEEISEITDPSDIDVVDYVTEATASDAVRPAPAAFSASNDSSAFRASQTVSGINVTVTAYDDGVIPKNAGLRVESAKKSSDDGKDITRAVLDSHDEESSIYDLCLLNISLVDENGEKVEPNGPVSVSLSMEEKKLPENVDTSVYHLLEKPDFQNNEHADDEQAAFDEQPVKTEQPVSDLAEEELIDILFANPNADDEKLRDIFTDIYSGDNTSAADETEINVASVTEVTEELSVAPADESSDMLLFGFEEISDPAGTSDSSEGSRFEAEKLEVEVSDEGLITFTTDSFSYFVVEFTYNEIEYVLDGEESVKLSDLLSSLSIDGYENIDEVTVSDPSYFKAEKLGGNGPESEWYVTSIAPFITTEWMHVTLDGKLYEITVTDASDYMKLTGDKVISSEIKLKKKTTYTVDLNGYVLSRGCTDKDDPYYASDTFRSGNVFRVCEKATLIIKSSNTEREHAGTLHGNKSGKVWFYDGKGTEIIKGGIITGGASDSNNRGGAITMETGAKLTLENVTIAGNVADNSWSAPGCGRGGAIHCWSANSVTMTKSRLCYNYAELQGGAVILYGDDSLLEMDSESRIDHNYTEGSGGGICAYGNNKTTIKNGRVTDNIAEKNGGGFATNWICTIKNTEFSYNVSNQDGGGLWIGQDSYVEYLSVHDNYAKRDGGGLLLANGVTLAHSNVKNNRATNGGGIISADAKLNDTTVTGNTALKEGGGVLVTTDVYSGGSDQCDLTLNGRIVITDNIANHSRLMDDVDPDKTADLYLEDRCYIKHNPDNHSEIGIAANSYRRVSSTAGPYNSKFFKTSKAFGYVYWDIEDDSPDYRYLVYTELPGQKYLSTTVNLVPGPARDLDGNGEISENERGTTPVVWNQEKFVLAHADTDERLDASLRAIFSDPAQFDGKFDILNGITRSECDTDTMYSYFYTDGYFFTDPVKYNTHLSTMSLILEKTGFNANTKQDSSGKEIGYINKFRAARQLLSDIGCEDSDIFISETFTIEPTPETIGYAIGSKKLYYQKKGETKKTDSGYVLIPIIVRGGGYDLEWVSNVTLGENGEAQGFGKAADDVFEGLKQYITDNGLETAALNGKLRFWVVGYSRGGATANLTSKRIIDYYKYGKAGGTGVSNVNNAVYGYTFEAPQGGSAQAMYTDCDYSSIHNIQNYGDVVTYVAPIDMGFLRYGVDHFVPGDVEADYSLSEYNGYLRTYAGSLNYDKAVTQGDVTGSAEGPVYRRDNNIWDTDTAEYREQKKFMRQQYSTMEPGSTFDDYFAEAELTEIQGLLSMVGIPGLEKDFARETGEGSYTMGDWLNDFMHYFQYWGVGLSENDTIENARSNYISSDLQTGLRAAMVFKETRTKKQMDNLSDRAGGAGFYARLATWYVNRNPETLYNILKDYKIIADDALPLNKTEAMGIFKALLKVYNADLKNKYTYGKGIARDYTTTSKESLMLGTLYYNIENIGKNHVPEVNLAWLRSYDSYYEPGSMDNWGAPLESTCYMVRKAEKSEVTVPEIAVSAKYTSDETVTSEIIVQDDGSYVRRNTRTDSAGNVIGAPDEYNIPAGTDPVPVILPSGMTDGRIYVKIRPSEKNKGGAVYYSSYYGDGEERLFRKTLTGSYDDLEMLLFDAYTRWYDTAGKHLKFELHLDAPLSEITGTATLSGTAQYGTKLTVNEDAVTPASSSNQHYYRWLRDDEYIEGADEITYTITADDLGKMIACEIHAENCTGIVKTDSKEAVPAEQTAPGAPVLKDMDDDGFSIHPMEGCEYQMLETDNPGSLLPGAWSQNTEFTGLDESRTYYVFARRATKTVTRESDGNTVTTHNASPASAALSASINDLWFSGNVEIDGDGSYGGTITAVVTEANADAADLRYKWYREGNVITGATEASYKVTADDIGCRLMCEVTAVTKTKGSISAFSGLIQKGTQLPPAMPEVTIKTGYSLVVKALAGCQYSIDDGKTWLPENALAADATQLFENLTPSTEYKIYARKAETANYAASAVSQPLYVTTEEASSLIGTVTFKESEFIYNKKITAVVSIAKNTGELSYRWYRSDTASGARTFITETVDEDYRTVAADVGRYITLIVTSSVETGELSATTATPVEKDVQHAPNMPDLLSKTENTINVVPEEGAEYQILTTDDPSALSDNGWTASTTITGLNTAANDYYIFARMAETEGYHASPVSTPLCVSANALLGDAVITGANGESVYVAATFGSALKADVEVENTDLPDNVELSFQWTRDGEPVAGTGGSGTITCSGKKASVTYTLTADDIGKMITCRFSHSSGSPKKGVIEADSVGPVRKASQEVPAVPALSEDAGNPWTDKIRIKVIAGTEYSIDGGQNWFPSPVSASDTAYTFTGLKENTQYKIYARKAETATHYASPYSDALNVTTDESYSLIINGMERVGETLEAVPTGKLSRADVTYAWYIGSTPDFSGMTLISGITGNRYSVQVSDLGKYIACKAADTSAGLSAYKVTGKITGEKSDRSAPAKPEILSQTRLSPDSDCTVTIKAVPGCVYIFDDFMTYDPGNDSSFVIEGLLPSTQYKVTAYYKETATYKQSPESEALIFTTQAKDDSELRRLINEAESLKGGVLVSVDGSDIYTTQKWTSAQSRNTFIEEIEKARTFVAETQVDRDSLISAITELKAAIDAFKAAIKAGTRRKSEPYSGGGGGSTTGVRGAVYGWWQLLDDGNWIFLSQNGYRYHGEWVYAYNPYAKPELGQPRISWFHFDAEGYMQTGFFTDTDGRVYYLNPISDNTKGMMMSGWQYIENSWYYFSQPGEGIYGSMVRNGLTRDGYFVDDTGRWIK